MNPRQRRGVALLAVSILGAGAVFAAISSYTASVSRRLGPTRPVLTLARDIPAYQQLTPGDLVARQVPQMYASAADLASFGQIDGRVPAVGLPRGASLQNGVLVPVPVAHADERELTVNVGVQDTVAASLAPLDRVDIVAAYRSDGDQAARAVLTVSGARVLRVIPLPKTSGIAGESRLAVTFALSPKQVQDVALAQTVAAGLRLALHPRGAPLKITRPKRPKEKA
jgi:pilus assembly protein CpaB